MNLRETVQLFADFKAGELLKERTVQSYLDHIGMFIKCLPAEQNCVQSSDIARFLAAERKRGLSPATIYNRYRALNVFFNWRANCKELGCPASPMADMKPPKLPQNEPRHASLVDVRYLIRVIPEHNWIDARDRAVIQLMLDTGLRLNEVASLLVKDVNLSERLVFVRYGKGGKTRRVPFTKKTVQFVVAYLVARPRSRFDKHMWLSSLNEDGAVRGVLTGYGIRLMLRRRCERNRISHINPHSIRHLFGVKALNDGIRIEIVSAMMGHSSIDFTRRVYAPLLTETTQREYDKNWK